eukprot:COSAG01_NODE_26435_length_714_cov_1.162602_1_plen_154_part_00
MPRMPMRRSYERLRLSLSLSIGLCRPQATGLASLCATNERRRTQRSVDSDDNTGVTAQQFHAGILGAPPPFTISMLAPDIIIESTPEPRVPRYSSWRRPRLGRQCRSCEASPYVPTVHDALMGTCASASQAGRGVTKRSKGPPEHLTNLDHFV